MKIKVGEVGLQSVSLLGLSKTVSQKLLADMHIDLYLLRLLSSLIPMSQNILGGSLPDDDEIDHDKTDTFKPWLRQPDTSDVLSQIKISGDKDLQQKIRKVCL